MKRLFYIPLLFLFLFNCKKDKVDIQPDEIIKPLVGEWVLTEREQLVNGKKVWRPVLTFNLEYLIFRSDGVMFDINGFASCCGPKELSINGSSFIVEPKTNVGYGHCANVNCAYCAVLDIDYSGDQMILTYCSGAKFKYFRN